MSDGYETKAHKAIGVFLPEAPSMFKVGLVADKAMDGKGSAKRRWVMVEYDDRMHLYQAWAAEGHSEYALEKRWIDAQTGVRPACWVPDWERGGRWLNCEPLWCDAEHLVSLFGTPSDASRNVKAWERMSNGGMLVLNLLREAVKLPLLNHGGR